MTADLPGSAAPRWLIFTALDIELDKGAATPPNLDLPLPELDQRYEMWWAEAVHAVNALVLIEERRRQLRAAVGHE